MKNEKTIKQIDLYLRGKLSEDDIHALWADIMKEPALLEYLETEGGLYHLFNSEKGGTAAEPDVSYSDKKKWSSLLILFFISGLPFFL